MGFLKNLRQGHEGEDWVKSTLSNTGINHYPPPCKKTDFAFSFHGKEYLAEVKHDIMSKHTGNLAIECINVNKSDTSGILSTEADVWFHVCYNPDKLILFNSTKNLKKKLTTCEPVRVVNRGGDNNANFFLFNIEYVIENKMLYVLYNHKVYYLLDHILS